MSKMLARFISSAAMFSLAVATFSSSAYQHPTVAVTKNATTATVYTTKYSTISSCSASVTDCPAGQIYSSIPLIHKPEMNNTSGHRVPVVSLVNNTAIPSTTLSDVSMTRFPVAPHTIVPVSSDNNQHINITKAPRIFSSALNTHKSQTIEPAYSQANRTASSIKYSTIDSCDSSNDGCPSSRVASNVVTVSSTKLTYSTNTMTPATNTAKATQGGPIATHTMSAETPENSDSHKNDHVTAAGRKIRRNVALMVAGTILSTMF